MSFATVRSFSRALTLGRYRHHSNETLRTNAPFSADGAEALHPIGAPRPRWRSRRFRRRLSADGIRRGDPDHSLSGLRGFPVHFLVSNRRMERKKVRACPAERMTVRNRTNPAGSRRSLNGQVLPFALLDLAISERRVG